jgi:ATP-binding cassette, subfamily C (CFTR/MRP), member 1
MIENRSEKGEVENKTV